MTYYGRPSPDASARILVCERELQKCCAQHPLLKRDLVLALMIERKANRADFESALAAMAARIPGEDDAEAEPARRPGLRPRVLAAVLAKIDADLARSHELSLANLAASAHLSEFHFARMFRVSMDTSPHDYIQRQRMELAKRLLAETTMPISAVTQAVGYRRQAHFTHAFRQRCGVTPGHFRRSLRETPAGASLVDRGPVDVVPGPEIRQQLGDHQVTSV